MRRATITATVEGRTYEIPEAWLVGATRSMGSAAAAVHHWHRQQEMHEEATR